MGTQLKESGILITLTTGIQVPPRKNRESKPRTAYENVVIHPVGVLLGIRGGGVPPGCPNPDPISDQKM